MNTTSVDYSQCVCPYCCCSDAPPCEPQMCQLREPSAFKSLHKKTLSYMDKHSQHSTYQSSEKKGSSRHEEDYSGSRNEDYEENNLNSEVSDVEVQELYRRLHKLHKKGMSEDKANKFKRLFCNRQSKKSFIGNKSKSFYQQKRSNKPSFKYQSNTTLVQSESANIFKRKKNTIIDESKNMIKKISQEQKSVKSRKSNEREKMKSSRSVGRKASEKFRQHSRKMSADIESSCKPLSQYASQSTMQPYLQTASQSYLQDCHQNLVPNSQQKPSQLSYNKFGQQKECCCCSCKKCKKKNHRKGCLTGEVDKLELYRLWKSYVQQCVHKAAPRCPMTFKSALKCTTPTAATNNDSLKQQEKEGEEKKTLVSIQQQLLQKMKELQELQEQVISKNCNQFKSEMVPIMTNMRLPFMRDDSRMYMMVHGVDRNSQLKRRQERDQGSKELQRRFQELISIITKLESNLNHTKYNLTENHKDQDDQRNDVKYTCTKKMPKESIDNKCAHNIQSDLVPLCQKTFSQSQLSHSLKQKTTSTRKTGSCSATQACNAFKSHSEKGGSSSRMKGCVEDAVRRRIEQWILQAEKNIMSDAAMPSEQCPCNNTSQHKLPQVEQQNHPPSIPTTSFQSCNLNTPLLFTKSCISERSCTK